jgi:Glyoxalase-like domain
MSGLVVDHVLIAVGDLDAAAAAVGRLGLPVAAGGRHPGWGTANRIVPVGGAYVELVAVVEPGDASSSPFGRWVAASPPGPMGWAVRGDDLDAIAGRLGLDPVPGSRAAPDGRSLRWRTAGVERVMAEPALPFFIAWEPGTPFPGAGTADVAIERIELRGDAARLGEWLGEAALPVAIRPGPAAVERIVLHGAGGAITLDAASLV